MNCDFSNFTSERMNRLATQYRESPNLRALIENMLVPLESVGEAICDLTFIDIDDATGDQLTKIGKALGWPREICAGVRPKKFGFSCDDGCQPDVGGFCTDWYFEDCGPDIPQGDFTFDSDDLYRRFLKSLVIKHDNDFRRVALVEAVQELFGDRAGILRESVGKVDVFTGRTLSDDEFEIAHVVAQVLPVALGVSVGVYETTNGPPFGFGDGWGGFCDSGWPTTIMEG